MSPRLSQLCPVDVEGRAPVVAVETDVVDPFFTGEVLGEGDAAIVDVGRPDELRVCGAFGAEDRDDVPPGGDVIGGGVAGEGAAAAAPRNSRSR